jgi:hypothetical protein
VYFKQFVFIVKFSLNFRWEYKFVISSGTARTAPHSHRADAHDTQRFSSRLASPLSRRRLLPPFLLLSASSTHPAFSSRACSAVSSLARPVPPRVRLLAGRETLLSGSSSRFVAGDCRRPGAEGQGPFHWRLLTPGGGAHHLLLFCWPRWWWYSWTGLQRRSIRALIDFSGLLVSNLHFLVSNPTSLSCCRLFLQSCLSPGNICAAVMSTVVSESYSLSSPLTVARGFACCLVRGSIVSVGLILRGQSHLKP